MTVRADFIWMAVLLAAGLGLTLSEASDGFRGRAAVPLESSAHRVDVDRATEAELRLLPGVGETLARRILQERRSGGPFGSIDDLARRVRGVGEARVHAWRSRGLVVEATSAKVAPGASTVEGENGR